MTQINAVNPNQYATSTSGVTGVAPRVSANGGGDTLPPVVPEGAGAGGAVLSLPTLAQPKLIPPDLLGMSLEQIIEAVGIQTRQVLTLTSLQTLEAKAKEREEANKESIKEIQKQLKNLEEKEKLSPFMKAFKWLGMVLGAIASAVTVAVGVATGNPVLVAAGVIMAVMAVNSIVSEATDGKVSISAGIAKLAEKCGASEETAKWIGFAFEMAITVVGVCLSFGAGITASAAKAAEAAGTVVNILAKASSLTTVASGITSIASGGLTIANAKYDYQITNSKAMQKELEGIMERLRAAIEMETDFLESVMKRAEELLADVKEIVEGNNEAQATILTGQAPSAA
ncbi:type III secretion system protein [Betaproteobacteria bacterium]|nr:type III secretion system protein [Betaproteobacteria bacterium]GHU00725.1 type III secretion system protein [Betaproteobacteria bacterium]GHU24488.1 type III secretion system protein [Betaproteobacteria bacterium]GHU30093.1 type III secretion system protein [Betaproteobacteria bacterium]